MCTPAKDLIIVWNHGSTLSRTFHRQRQVPIFIFIILFFFFQISILLLSQRKVQLKPVFWNVILNPSSSTLTCSPINKQKRHKFPHTFCFIEYGSFFLYQKTIIKSTFCFVAYIHVFDNESKCVVFVFISIPSNY